MGGYSFFSSSETDKFKLSPKGPTYGGFIGIGKDFVGLEGFYQTFSTSSKIKHEGETGEVNYNANAFGAALRFSFQLFYLRLGLGNYTLSQDVKLDNAANIPPAERAYGIDDGASHTGVLYGIGVHNKFKIGRASLDLTRHQISGVGSYTAISLGLSWVLPDSLFSVSNTN